MNLALYKLYIKDFIDKKAHFISFSCSHLLTLLNEAYGF